MTKEIEIVGAGPAGLVAAINLDRVDFKVTVCEGNKNLTTVNIYSIRLP